MVYFISIWILSEGSIKLIAYRVFNYRQVASSIVVFSEGIIYNWEMNKCRTGNINPLFSYIVDLERLIAEIIADNSKKFKVVR